MIEETKIKEKLKKFLNREPSRNEIENGKKDLNIVNEIILDRLDEQDKTILDLQAQLLKIKK